MEVNNKLFHFCTWLGFNVDYNVDYPMKKMVRTFLPAIVSSLFSIGYIILP